MSSAHPSLLSSVLIEQPQPLADAGGIADGSCCWCLICSNHSPSPCLHASIHGAWDHGIIATRASACFVGSSCVESSVLLWLAPMGVIRICYFFSVLISGVAQPEEGYSREQLQPLTKFRQQHRRTVDGRLCAAAFVQDRWAVCALEASRFPSVELPGKHTLVAQKQRIHQANREGLGVTSRRRCSFSVPRLSGSWLWWRW